MNIKFSDHYAVNPETFGINFEAHKDGNRVVCIVSCEALQDIDTANVLDEPVQQFLRNRLAFEGIATDLLEQGLEKDGFLHIGSENVGF